MCELRGGIPDQNGADGPQRRSTNQLCSEIKYAWPDFDDFLQHLATLAGREKSSKVAAELESTRGNLLDEIRIKEADLDELRGRLENCEQQATPQSCTNKSLRSCSAPPSPQSPKFSVSKLGAMDEVERISKAHSPAEILNIPTDSNIETIQKAWKRLVFQLHPDKLALCTEDEKSAAADALHALHRARDEFRETIQASGIVDVPEQLESAGKPVCTRWTPGQRRFECRWQVPEMTNRRRPIEKYEVYGPRIFAHDGEPMEWVLLATLPKLEGCFVFVEESPTQNEVMSAGDRCRVPSVPLTVHSVNGRGRSEPLYFHLPWQSKFPWLQGAPSMICRQCCTVQPKPAGSKSDKVLCGSCGACVSPSAAGLVLRCFKCHGEALWDSASGRLDCRMCGRHMAMHLNRCVPSGRQTGSTDGVRSGGRSVPPQNRR